MGAAGEGGPPLSHFLARGGREAGRFLGLPRQPGAQPEDEPRPLAAPPPQRGSPGRAPLTSRMRMLR